MLVIKDNFQQLADVQEPCQNVSTHKYQIQVSFVLKIDCDSS